MGDEPKIGTLAIPPRFNPLLKISSISQVLIIENHYIDYGRKQIQTRNEMNKTSSPYLTELLAPDMLMYCSSKNGWNKKITSLKTSSSTY